MVKKLICVCFAVLVMTTFVITAFAADGPTVYSDAVVTTLKEQFVVPVSIKGNTGVMGFRITVKYPEAQFRLKNITSGSLTKSGLFNTTVSDFNQVKNTFDVVWSNTENVTGEGTLFMLTFETNGYADYGDYKIELSFSQDDTFDEQYKPVTLKCEPVTVKIADAKGYAKQQSSQTATAAEKSAGKPVADDYLIASVQAVMESFGEIDIANITDASQQESIVKFVNSRDLAYSSDAKQYQSFDELKADYNKALTNDAVTKVLESVDGDKIITLSDTILKKYGADTFSELSAEDKKAAVGEAVDAIAGEGGETRNFASVSDEDDAAQMLDGILSGAEEEQKSGIQVPDAKPKLKMWMIILIAAAGVIVVAACIAAVVIYKKKKSEKNAE